MLPEWARVGFSEKEPRIAQVIGRNGELAAILRIRPAPRALPKVAQLARDTPEVVECHRITGEDCFFLKLHVRDVEHLEEVIDAFAFFGQTTTSVMQTSPVPRRAVSAPGADTADR